MGGTGTNKGVQDIQYKYYDPLNSDHFDKRHLNVVPVGVYSGGLCERITDISIYVHPMVAEIASATQQARVKTSAAYVLAVAPATPYVVLSWDWQALTAWYMDIKAVAVASITATDIVLAKCHFTGGTLNYMGYPNLVVGAGGLPVGTPRVPKILSKFCEPQVVDYTPLMQIFVNGGWISYGDSFMKVDGQLSPVMAAPVANPRIDVIYLDTSGSRATSANVLVATGDEDPSPVAKSHGGKLAIAEVSLYVGQTSIVAADILDVRPFLNLGGGGGLSSTLSAFLTMGA